MGTYATTTSLPYLLVHFLKSNATVTDAFGATLASHHIARAESVVNSYLALRYSMPFSTVPPVVTHLSEQLACYNIIKSSSYMDLKQANPYLEEFKSAFETLRMISDGDIPLTYTDGSIVPTISNNILLSSTETYTPIFGRDDATAWARDDNEISDTESDRSG